MTSPGTSLPAYCEFAENGSDHSMDSEHNCGSNNDSSEDESNVEGGVSGDDSSMHTV